MKLTIVLKKQDAIGLGGQILEAMGMKRSVYEPEVFVAQHIADPRIIAPVDVTDSMWPIMYVEALMDEGIRPVRVMQKDNSVLGLTPLFASTQAPAKPSNAAVADLLDAAADALEAGCGCDDSEGVCECGASGIPGADGTCENCGLPMQMATDEAAVIDISVPMCRSASAELSDEEAAAAVLLAQLKPFARAERLAAAVLAAPRAPKGTPTDINKFALNEYLNGKNAHMAPKGVITRVHNVDHPHLKRMVGAGWLEAAPGVKNGWVLSAIGKKGMDEWTAQQAAAAAKWAKPPAPDRWDGAPASLETSARDIPEGLSSQEARTISKHILSRYDWTDFGSATADDFRLAEAFIESFEKEYGKFQPIKIVPAVHLSMTLGSRVALIYEGWTDEAEKLQFSPEMERLMRKLGSWFEAYNHWSATIYNDKKPQKASTVKSSKGVIDMKTWKTIREKANDALEKAGFDGNGRFKNMGQANGKLADVLSKFGLQLGDVMSADLFREDSRTHNFSLEFVNPMDSFSPVAFDDSMVHFSYAKLSPDRIEVVAYLS